MGGWRTPAHFFILKKEVQNMTLGQLIAEIETVKPHQFPKETITRWLTEVENTAVEQIFNRVDGVDIHFEKFDYDMDHEKELQIPDHFADVYMTYVSAKIDYANREFGGYNNAVSMYQAAFDELAAYWKRTHKPKTMPKMRYF
jgi:hypothetical protein